MRQLLENGTIAENIIAFMVIGSIVFLSITIQPIPEALTQLALVIIGFYFGRKANGVSK